MEYSNTVFLIRDNQWQNLIKINGNQNLNLTRKSQNENQKVLFESIGKFFSDNPDQNSFTARDLIGSGAISAKGVENSLRKYDDLFSSFSEGKDKHYFVNQIGEYNFLLNYSSKLSNSNHDNNKRGLIVFSRTNDDLHLSKTISKNTEQIVVSALFQWGMMMKILPTIVTWFNC